MSMPSSSATTCAIVVSTLCPWLPLPMNTSALPAMSMRTVTCSAPAAPKAGEPSM